LRPFKKFGCFSKLEKIFRSEDLKYVSNEFDTRRDWMNVLAYALSNKRVKEKRR
jgi:hypothetical protein